jgi:hypothetical protein
MYASDMKQFWHLLWSLEVVIDNLHPDDQAIWNHDQHNCQNTRPVKATKSIAM